MKTDSRQNFSARTITVLFYVFLLVHLLFWTLAPLFTRVAVSNDVIEAIVWAQHLSFGYDKNPWVIGWITHLGISFGGVVGYYFMQQLCIVVGIWAVFQLGKQFYSIKTAFIAALSLSVCLAFSVYVQINNDNFALFGFLMLGIYCFYTAITSQQLKFWLLTGLFLGLALMTKYSAALFFIVMLCFLLQNATARASFKKPGVYLMGIVILLLALPNIVWLWQHNFTSISYALARRNQNYAQLSFFAQHWLNPISFVRNISGIFLPSLLIILCALPFRLRTTQLSNCAQSFLFWFGLMPILSLFFIGFILGWTVYQEWAVPMLGLIPLLIFNFFVPATTNFAIKRVYLSLFVLLSLTFMTTYIINNITQSGKGSADYPAQAVADYVTKIWHNKYHAKLKYIAGSRYPAGYVAYYSKDRPKVFVDWDTVRSPGIKLKDVKKYGAIFIQDGNYGSTDYITAPPGYNTPTQFPDSILKRYPQLLILPIKKFPYHHNSKQVREYANILVGILPPTVVKSKLDNY